MYDFFSEININISKGDMFGNYFSLGTACMPVVHLSLRLMCTNKIPTKGSERTPRPLLKYLREKDIIIVD